jgi:hypothetical protein
LEKLERAEKVTIITRYRRGETYHACRTFDLVYISIFTCRKYFESIGWDVQIGDNVLAASLSQDIQGKLSELQVLAKN